MTRTSLCREFRSFSRPGSGIDFLKGRRRQFLERAKGLVRDLRLRTAGVR